MPTKQAPVPTLGMFLAMLHAVAIAVMTACLRMPSVANDLMVYFSGPCGIHVLY